MFSPPLYYVYKFKFSDLVKSNLQIVGNRESLLQYRISQQDNMLFRQIRLITGFNNKFNKYVVFVDIHGFSTKRELFDKMVLDGFYINNQHFMCSERSPSMTRNSILSFVSEEIFDELDKRISMGIEFEETVLAKYVGYRGLMFSSCHCFENWIPKIIIVPDGYATIKNQNIKYVVDKEIDYVDKETGENKKWTQKDIVQGIKDIKINMFDGSGIHHPAITQSVKYRLNSKNSPTSIMWRAPFIKGVTHEVDYTTFFTERGIAEIKDIWGVYHNVKDPMIIMTESMYKGYKYFKKDGTIKDWETYWEQFRKHGHCLGVAKWNFSRWEEPIYTRANYQILQDLKLNYDDFQTLANKTIEWINKVVGEDIRYTYCFLGLLYDMHDPQTDYVRAILKNPEMIKEKTVREYIVNLLKKYIDDSKCGKIYLKSTFKILAPDLIALMEHIGGLPVRGCLNKDEFFTSGINGIYNGEFCIERNPHICQSEHVILNATTNYDINKYISHLSNICMINCKSLTPQRLNGADTDGDLVLVLDEPIFKNGIDRDCPIVIDIEDKATTLSEKYTKENLLKLILRSVTSLIGETSNCATSYRNKTPKTQEQKDKYDKYIDLLSVINGKCIDSTKTGVIYNIPRHIAKGGRPLPYFMKYRSDYYAKQKELSKANSNMNRLCFDIEKWAKTNIKFKKTYKEFDYNIMINEIVGYTDEHFSQIEKIFLDFDKEIAEIQKESSMFRNPLKYQDFFKENYSELSMEEIQNFTYDWNYYYDKYKRKCKEICPNKQELANIAVKLCYEKYPNKNKKFIWRVASEGVLLNLKQESIYLPKLDLLGEFEYLGKRYTMKEVFSNDKRNTAGSTIS